MALQMISCFLLLACLNQGLSIRLDATPTIIEPGITKSLSLNCTLLKGSLHKLNGLTSIILSRKVEGEENEIVPLASINSITGRTIVYTAQALGSGVINNKGDSYISLKWLYPMQNMAGQYRCEAHGLDMEWRSLIISEETNITKAEISSSLVTNGLRNLLISVDYLTSKFETLNSRIDSSKFWYFKRSEVYKGRRYYLSQQDPISRSEESMAICVFYGGYLVEIDDWDEFNFVKAFIKQFGGFSFVLTGGTDEAKEGVWKYRHSNTSVPSYIIHSRHLGNQRNCLYLCDEVDWFGIDDYCYFTYSSWPTRFLCEIPESKH